MDILNLIAHSFIVLPLVVLLIQNLVQGQASRNICRQLCTGLTVVQAVLTVVAMAVMWNSGINRFDFGLFSSESAYLSFDYISLIVILCVALAGFASALVSFTTENTRKLRFSNLFVLLVLGMNCITLVNDLFSTYVFLEVIGVASFVIIAIPKKEKFLEGSYKYLVLSSVASIFVLSGITLMFFEVGNLNFDVLQAFDLSTLTRGGYTIMIFATLLLVAGFAIKAGIAPFHGWLPDAYEGASGAVSVMLAGCVNKAAGIYCIIRIVGVLFSGIMIIEYVLTALGIVSILIGAFAAFKQSSMKRMLAYSSISQMGYILLGICSGSHIGLVGAAFHTLNHTTFKSTLFTNAAAIESQTGTLKFDELGGLQSRMPVTGVTNILAFLSTAGIPPLSGFWSKFLIIMAVWQSVSPICAGIALFASILTCVYFLRMQGKVFFGSLPDSLKEVKEAPANITVAEISLSVITVGLGIVFPLVLKLLASGGLL